MPRPGRGPRVAEKPKDFFGSIFKLLKDLKSWILLLFIAIVLAFFSAIMALVAPNMLSDLADEIQKGLVPKTEVFEEISKKIYGNFTEEKLKEKVVIIQTSSEISTADNQTFMETMGKMQTVKDPKEGVALISSLPESILEVLFDDIKVKGKIISVDDQIEMMTLTKNLSQAKMDKNTLKVFEKLPKSVYNLVKPTIDINTVKHIAFMMALLYVLSALFGYIQSYSMCTVSNGYAKKLRSNISGKINKLPLRYFDNHESGDVLSRVTNDVDSIAHNLNQSLASLISQITLFLGSIIMMFVTNWIMAITAILSTIVGFMFMFIILGKSQKYFIENQRVLGELNGYIEEMYSGHTVVKAYNGKASAIEEFEVLNKRLYKAKKNSIFLSGLMQPVMGFVGNFGYVAVCVVGALLVMNNHITFGVIVAFMIYIRLFTNPLSQIAQSMTTLQSIAAACERVFEFLEEEEMVKEEVITHLHRHKVKGNIEFKNVKFGYDEDKTIIKNFSCKAKPGQKIAIVGPTGAGKTTMVNLLMKFYDIKSGDIIIDGVSVKDLTRENIHKLFVMVLQDTWLFNGTIKENIRFNQKDITDEEIWEVCKVVGIDHFIKTLPGGLDSVLGENDSISSGQKQLLTIARGMVEDAPFLILDEATSNVDTRTEELVQKAMDKLTEGRTSFIIAHRLSTIKNADLILVMKDGNIIEQGNHDELMKKKGSYFELYNSQFEL